MYYPIFNDNKQSQYSPPQSELLNTYITNISEGELFIFIKSNNCVLKDYSTLGYNYNLHN